MSFERMVEIPTWSRNGVICVHIYERDLPTITDEDLEALEISRSDLHRVFAEGMRLMEERGATASDRVRPCAHQTRDGEWEVVVVGYSKLSDPLMQGA